MTRNPPSSYSTKTKTTAATTTATAAAAAAATATATTTVIATTKQTTRRLNIWFQQQWRGIPAAKFDTFPSSRTAAATTTPTTPTSTKNVSASVIASGNELRTTRNNHDKYDDDYYKANNDNVKNDKNDNDYYCNVTNATINTNVDQALQSFHPRRSVFGMDVHTDDNGCNIHDHCHHDDNPNNNNNNYKNHIPLNFAVNDPLSLDPQLPMDTPPTFDWILDGYPEWHKTYQRSKTLWEQLYPTRIDIDTLTGLIVATTNVKEEDEEEEQTILLKLGCPSGRQEYLFASFDDKTDDDPQHDHEEDHHNKENDNEEEDEDEDEEDKDLEDPTFQAFWEMAIAAPTPQGTFDLGSGSTYATPTPTMMMTTTTKTTTTTTTTTINQKQQQEQERIQRQDDCRNDHQDRHHHHEDDDDDDEFGEFQQPQPHQLPEYSNNQQMLDNDNKDNDSDPPSHPPPPPPSSSSSSQNQSLSSPAEQNHQPLSTITVPSTPTQSPTKNIRDERYEAGPQAATTPITRNHFHFNENDHDDDDYDNQEQESDDDDEEEEEEDDDSSLSESSHPTIPSEVQLFTNRPNNNHVTLASTSSTTRIMSTTAGTPISSFPSIVIPKTNRFISTTMPSPSSPPPPPSSSSSLLLFYNHNHYPHSHHREEDTPSITSSLASPEARFLRRKEQSYTLDDHNSAIMARQLFDSTQQHPPNDEGDDDDDNESLASSLGGTLLYRPEMDMEHTVQELQKLEWDWLPFWKMNRLLQEQHGDGGGGGGCNSRNSYDYNDTHNHDDMCDTSKIPLLQDQITQRLSKLDLAYNALQRQLHKRIQPHKPLLQKANQDTLDLQKHLVLARMYLTRSQEAISMARYGTSGRNNRNDDNDHNHYQRHITHTRSTPAEDSMVIVDGVGVQGAIQLLDLWKTRTFHQELQRIFHTVTDLLALEQSILQRIEYYDVYKTDAIQECHDICDSIQELRTKSQDPTLPVSRLQCLDGMRERTLRLVSQTFLHRLHDCLEDMAVQWCQNVSAGVSENVEHNSSLLAADKEAYGRLMKAIMFVYSHPDLRSKDDDNNDKSSATTVFPTFAQAICTSIQTSLLMETQKAFGRSLLNPSGVNNAQSMYSTELNALSFGQNYLDSTRLPIWTHNLVTIRFDFEMKEGRHHLLAPVVHKLCILLSNVLFGMKHIMDWHHNKIYQGESVNSDFHTLLVKIHEELRTRRAGVWNACVQSLEQCLEEYTKFVGRKKLFHWKKDTCDDSDWYQDLVSLHDVTELTEQFLSLGAVFLEGVPVEIVNDGSLIGEKLNNCLQRHVRSVHVEAMNSLGGLLHREDWKPLTRSFDKCREETGDDGGIQGDIKNIVQDILDQITTLSHNRTTQVIYRSHNNGFKKISEGYCLCCPQGNNPFDHNLMPCDLERKETDSDTMALLDWMDPNVSTICDLLSTYLGQEISMSSGTLITKSMAFGIFPWFARLLVIQGKLPRLTKDIIGVLTNIFDLYITTVFRLCAGNVRNERLLLGIDTPQNFPISEDCFVNENSSATQNFSFGFGSKPQHQSQSYYKPSPQTVSPNVEAEMCMLVPSESYDLPLLRNLLSKSQKSLEGIAKLDLVDSWIRDPFFDGEETIGEEFASKTTWVLQKRLVASCNLIFLSLALHLVTDQLSTMAVVDECLVTYRNSYIRALPVLLKLNSRIIAMRAIRGKTLVKEIISAGSVWEESKLHEQPNDYVEEICDFMALMWQSILRKNHSENHPCQLPRGLLKIVWANLVGGGYMVFLHGFGMVRCSTEGRALMSMDVAAYTGRLRQILSEHHECCLSPRDIEPYRTMAYVDMYIKTFYFPPKDILIWIKENYQDYLLNHSLALALSTASNFGDAKNALQIVRGYYYSSSSSLAVSATTRTTRSANRMNSSSTT